MSCGDVLPWAPKKEIVASESSEERIQREIEAAWIRTDEISDALAESGKQTYEVVKNSVPSKELWENVVLPLQSWLKDEIAEINEISDRLKKLGAGEMKDLRAYRQLHSMWHDLKGRLVTTGNWTYLNTFDPHKQSSKFFHLDCLLTSFSLRSLLPRLRSIFFKESHDCGVEIRLNTIKPEMIDLKVCPQKGRLFDDVIRNLVHNSIKYHNPSVEPGSRFVEIMVNPLDDFIVVGVTDNGRGMSPEMLQHYGEMWRRDPAVISDGIPGQGIGASSIIANVSKLGGTFKIDSIEGIGTTVRIQFPRSIFMPAI